MVALDETLAVENGTVTHQRRGIVEQDNINLVGTQGTRCIACDIELKTEPILRIQAGLVPDGNITWSPIARTESSHPRAPPKWSATFGLKG
jgi:hypothetical protein